MKRYFQYIGLFSLVCFSFFLTEKTATVVQEVDEIMLQIKKEYKNYEEEGMDATIKEDTIVPGLSKKEVNISKSYDEMKKIGIYDKKMYVYKTEKTSKNLDNHLDKYIISGNPKKRMVSIFFTLNGYSLQEVLEKIGSTKVSFILTNIELEENIEEVEKMIENGYEFFISDSKMSEFLSTKQKLITLRNPSEICYNENKNKEFLDICRRSGYYTVYTDKIQSEPLKNTKKILKSGSFLNYQVNEQLLKEFPTILSAIQSKGYKLILLSEHIKED